MARQTGETQRGPGTRVTPSLLNSNNRQPGTNQGGRSPHTWLWLRQLHCRWVPGAVSQEQSHKVFLYVPSRSLRVLFYA